MAVEHGATLQPRTGQWPTAIMGAPRLQWLAANQPEALKRAAHFFSISDWLTWRLSDQVLADASQASASLLFRLANANLDSDFDWDWEWRERDDMFGETPDDTYDWGVTDGEQDIYHTLATMLGLSREQS